MKPFVVLMKLRTHGIPVIQPKNRHAGLRNNLSQPEAKKQGLHSHVRFRLNPVT